MPLYSASPEYYPGSIDFPCYPCWGVDGNGMDVGPCKTVNTDTGECLKVIWNEERNGLVTRDDGSLAEITETHPLPITFHREKKGW